MAEIIVNGCVKIKPTGIPAQVDAKRDLERILKGIEVIHRKFVALDSSENETIETIYYNDTNILLRDYENTLNKCADALEGLQDGSLESSYYRPLIEFLHRASDPHTVLPFHKYLMTWAFSGAPNKTPLQGITKEEFKDFIELRMVEAMNTCQSYMTLLSKTMDAPISLVNISGTVSQTYNIAKQRAIYNILGRNLNEGKVKVDGLDRFAIEKVLCKDDSYKEKFKARKDGEPLVAYQFELFQRLMAEENKSNDAVIRAINYTTACQIDYAPSIYSFEPMIYFYLVNTFGNHFKAAHEEWGYNGGNGVPPSIDVKIMPYGPDHVAIISEDKGVGIPHDILTNLFNPDVVKDFTYNANLMGDRSTVYIYPMLCDLLSANLIVESDGKGKGSTWTFILPKTLENPKELAL